MTSAGPSIHVTPATTDLETARRWFEEFEGAGLDGVVAKPLTLTYQPDKRVMFKIKHERTADCVVAGYRVHKSGADAIGSLLLGLYQDDGQLASVGVIGAFPMVERRRLFAEMQPLVTSFEGHPWNWAAHEAGERTPRKNEFSRWNVGKTFPLCRCGPSAWWRSATTIWKADGSGTRPSSTGGAPTGIPSRAPTRNSSNQSPSVSATSCRASGRLVPRQRGSGCASSAEAPYITIFAKVAVFARIASLR